MHTVGGDKGQNTIKTKRKKNLFIYNMRKLQNATGFILFVTKVIITSMAFPLTGFSSIFYPTIESLCNENYWFVAL